jgi:hypothetical protein
MSCCTSSHEPPDTACKRFERGANGRCVYCDHEEKCHPGPGATCEIGSGERGYARKVRHKNLGECLVTEACLHIQRTNPDTWTMFVEHDGELKEVTKALVVEKDFSRAAGDAVCEWCGKKYCDHPTYTKFAEEALGVPFGFHQLCDGRVVKT